MRLPCGRGWGQGLRVAGWADILGGVMQRVSTSSRSVTSSVAMGAGQASKQNCRELAGGGPESVAAPLHTDPSLHKVPHLCYCCAVQRMSNSLSRLPRKTTLLPLPRVTHQQLEGEKAGQREGEGDVADGGEQAGEVQEGVGEGAGHEEAAAGGVRCVRQAVDPLCARVGGHRQAEVPSFPSTAACFLPITSLPFEAMFPCSPSRLPALPARLKSTTVELQSSQSWRGLTLSSPSTPSGSSNHCGEG